MYNLIDPKTNVQLEQASEINELFRKIDIYVKKGRPIMITDESGKVRGYVGKALEDAQA